MPLRTTETDKDQDAAYNPGEIHAAEQFPEAYTSGGIDQLEAFANDPNNQSDNDTSATKSKNSHDTGDEKTSKNIADVKSREETGSTHKNSFTGGSSKQTGIKGMIPGLKKKGPLGIIILLLLTAGGGLSFFSLSILPVQFKEAFFSDLNDQVAAMDLRTDHMLRAKLKSLSPGASSCGTVKIRCKFTSMSDKQVEKFKKAGFEMDTEKNAFGRQVLKPGGMTFKNGTTSIKITDPGHLISLANSDPSIRSALRKAYNPKFAGFSDKVAQLKLRNFKTDKAKKIVGESKEQFDKSVDNATAGDKAFSGLTNKSAAQDDGDGKKYHIDESGNKVYELDADGKENPKFKELATKLDAANAGGIDKINDLASTAGKATSGVFKSFGKGLSLTGALDTACTVYNTARAVSAAAKVTRAIQLVQFFMVFANFADSVKAGDATEAEATYVGNKLTEVDTSVKVVNETSLSAPDAAGNVTVTEVDNPSYNKNALDSDGYKIAAYNEAPFPSARTLQFAVGGGLVGGLAKVLDTVSEVLNLGLADSPKQARKNIRATCSTVQSWWARTIGLVAGIVSAIGTFGASTIASIGASVAIGFAMPFLEAALADIVAGKVVSHETANTDIGDASFGGAGALMGGLAQARGMEPANAEEIKAYMAVTEDIKNKNIAMETYEAKDTPFDIYNQYSFMGSLTRKITPTIVKSQASVSAALTSIPTFIGSAFSTLIPQANATTVFNPERFNKCGDDGYDDVGIDADVMCNTRYVMSGTELSMDSETALSYMIDNKQISPEDGTPVVGSAYEEWVENCPNRVDGWGESSDADSNNSDLALGIACKTNGSLATNLPVIALASTGVKTVQASNTAGVGPYEFFRVYHMDSGISDGMDQEDVVAGDAAADAAALPASPNSAAPTPTPGLDPITTIYTGAEARRLAGLVANAPNITWSESSKSNLLKYAAGENVTNACGEPMGVSPYLSSVLLSLTKSRYKLTIEGIGFPGERDCEGGTFQHPKGNAVDIQELSIIGGLSGSAGLNTYDANTKQVTSQFATDWLALLPTEAGAAVRGGVGQGPCGVSPTFPPNTYVDHAFDDSCDHLHIDVRNWKNLYEKIDPTAK